VHLADLLRAAPLRAGDSLFIPRAEQFSILGEVQKPAMYKLEADLTVEEAISVAGGITPKGSERRVEIRRTGPDGKQQVIHAKLSDPVANYIVGIVRATRSSPDLSYGASPRSGAMLAAAARAHAALDGRDYVIPDDVKALALPAFRHRVVLSPAAEIDGRKADDIIKQIMESVEAPR